MLQYCLNLFDGLAEDSQTTGLWVYRLYRVSILDCPNKVLPEGLHKATAHTTSLLFPFAV